MYLKFKLFPVSKCYKVCQNTYFAFSWMSALEKFVRYLLKYSSKRIITTITRCQRILKAWERWQTNQTLRHSHYKSQCHRLMSSSSYQHFSLRWLQPANISQNIFSSRGGFINSCKTVTTHCSIVSTSSQVWISKK